MVNAMYGDSSYLAQWRPQDGSDVVGNPMTSDINTGFTSGPAAVARQSEQEPPGQCVDELLPAAYAVGPS